MATGQLLGDGKIRYTFTDYIDYKVNVIANLNLNLFIDPRIVKNNGEETLTSKLNGKNTEKRLKLSIKMELESIIQTWMGQLKHLIKRIINSHM